MVPMSRVVRVWSKAPMKRSAAGLAAVVLAVWLYSACGNGGGESAVPTKNVVDIDIKVFAEEVRQDLIADGRLDSFLVLGARLPSEFEIRSIPGAISMPYGGSTMDPNKQFFSNPVTGRTGAEALTMPDGSPIPRGRRMIFYSGRSG